MAGPMGPRRGPGARGKFEKPKDFKKTTSKLNNIIFLNLLQIILVNFRPYFFKTF